MPNTQHGGNVAFMPPMDSVQEFKVSTNAYDAAIGRQAGATVNMQTRSGGKQYHGTMYEWNQNNMLNANLFQTNLVGGAVPPIHFNEWGATLGGPVWIPKVYHGKEKTFFFFSYDDTWNQDPRPGSTRSVPTSLERGGDFTQSFTTQNGQRFPIQIWPIPSSVDAKTWKSRVLFPGMIIPKKPSQRHRPEHPGLRPAAEYGKRVDQQCEQQFRFVGHAAGQISTDLRARRSELEQLASQFRDRAMGAPGRVHRTISSITPRRATTRSAVPRTSDSTTSG